MSLTIPFKVTVFKTGNSYAITLPPEIRDYLGITLGDEMELRVIDHEIIVKKKGA